VTPFERLDKFGLEAIDSSVGVYFPDILKLERP
jgi:hypothetical protein